MKTLVISPYGLFNYGNRLQNYAVTRILRNYGLESETLVLPGINAPTGYKERAKAILWRKPNPSIKAKRYRSFLQFDKLIPKKCYPSRNAYLKSAPKSYSYVVLGSDQLWNPYQLSQDSIFYGYPFDRETIVCIAPSFGVSSIEELAAEENLSDLLHGIGHLNVREAAGKDIIEKLSGLHAPILIDPTLALPATDWNRVADDRFVPDEPYAFVYMLGKDAAYMQEEIEHFCRINGMRQIRLLDPSSEYYQAGPQDFISLICHSSFVCTNSFHAVAFSLIFGRPFRVFQRRTEGYSMGSRLDTLSLLFHLDSLFSNRELATSDLSNEVVVNAVSANLPYLREQFYSYFDAIFRNDYEQ